MAISIVNTSREHVDVHLTVVTSLSESQALSSLGRDAAVNKHIDQVLVTGFGDHISATTRQTVWNVAERWYALHPLTHDVVEIDPEQRWFWTQEWQAGERAVDAHIQRGELEEITDLRSYFDSL